MVIRTRPVVRCLRCGLLVLAIIGAFYLFHARGETVEGTLSNIMNTAVSPRPNAQLDVPHLRADSLSVIENWLTRCGWPWRKQEIVVEKRKLVCVDLAPYSGQPGRHLFVYQILEKQVSMIFCSVVHNPPKQGAELSCKYEKETDSLAVCVDGNTCLSIRLATLWCD